jgi:hypothetical protein
MTAFEWETEAFAPEGILLAADSAAAIWVLVVVIVSDNYLATGYFCAFAVEMADDARRDLHHAGGMDEQAIRRAALITLRRAILKRFPPGPERTRWLVSASSHRDGRSWEVHRAARGR